MKISNYTKAVIFLLLLTALGSSVYAQTLPSQQPHSAQSGSSTTVLGSGSFPYVLVAVIVIIIVVVVAVIAIIRQSKKKNMHPQPTTEKALVICPKCYNRIDAVNDFCPKCGTDIRPKNTQ